MTTVEKSIHNMEDQELLKTYQYYKEVVADNIQYCKEYGYLNRFTQSDYSRVRVENEMLRLKIELLQRGWKLED